MCVSRSESISVAFLVFVLVLKCVKSRSARILEGLGIRDHDRFPKHDSKRV